MHTTADAITALRSVLPDLAHEFGVRSLLLFGSAARGELRDDSDIDILVEFDRPIGLFRFFALADRLSDLLGRPVDLGAPESLKPRLRERVLQEAVRVA